MKSLQYYLLATWHIQIKYLQKHRITHPHICTLVNNEKCKNKTVKTGRPYDLFSLLDHKCTVRLSREVSNDQLYSHLQGKKNNLGIHSKLQNCIYSGADFQKALTYLYSPLLLNHIYQSAYKNKYTKIQYVILKNMHLLKMTCTLTADYLSHILCGFIPCVYEAFQS